MRQRLWTEVENNTDHPLASPDSIDIRDGRIYQYTTAQINFTTYNVRRDVDVIRCSRPSEMTGFSLDKTTVMVNCPENDVSLPCSYAIVLGVFHANILLPNSPERRLDFLWVRWFDRDNSWIAGPGMRRLERLFLSPLGVPDSFGFVDPASVIRGCHIIPAFHYNRAPPSGHISIARQHGDDWTYYYMNR